MHIFRHHNIRNEVQKLDVYKRIAAIGNDEDYDEMADGIN